MSEVWRSRSQTALILSVTPNSTPVSTPLTTYGASIGSQQNLWAGNDSGAQGMSWATSKDWLFQAVQIGSTVPSGYTIILLGTNDFRVLMPEYVSNRPTPYIVTPTGRDAVNHLPIALNVQNGDTSIPANSWIQLPSPSDQALVGQLDANPITTIGQTLHAKRPLLAVRAVLIASAAATGQLGICVTAI